MVFNYRQDQLCAEDCTLAAIAATVGTPSYIYSRRQITQQCDLFMRAFADIPHQLCYAVKANSNLAVLNILARLNTGFDIVSGGELARVLQAGGDPKKIIFSGVGKQDAEITAALTAGIGCFNVESAHELVQLNHLASLQNGIAPIALRINPDIAVSTHPYIATGLKENKFGIPWQQAPDLYQQAAQLPHVKVIGIASHLGSQIMEIAPFLQALDKLLAIADQLNLPLSQIDIGGGFGMDYHDNTQLSIMALAQAMQAKLAGRQLKLLFEPGRAIVANAGILLTTVLSLKTNGAKAFAIVDAGMNDLIRPALYEAWHDILPVKPRQESSQIYDVVGPVCETGDFLGKNRALAICPQDLLAITMAGAYGFVMSSHYNSRPRAAEVMVDGEQFYIVRQRETMQSLWTGEQCLP